MFRPVKPEERATRVRNKDVDESFSGLMDAETSEPLVLLQLSFITPYFLDTCHDVEANPDESR